MIVRLSVDLGGLDYFLKYIKLRIVYSECWGGVYGNTGLAVAQDGKINFYELKSF